MAPNTLAPGAILGERFAIVGALGTGGTATVYLAVDQLRGMRIALKVVHAHLANDPAVRRRIQREVRAATVLQHEAALVPWDLHEVDGHLCLTMPYHEGQTLSEHVAASGPLSLDEARTLGIRIASALADAHRSGLLHRDVTGNNVLVKGGGEAVITDFGLSRAQTDTTRSTGMLGTAGYAAPEVYAGERADPRADLYGLGCVLYLAVTGQTPFGTGNPMATLQRQLSDDLTSVRDLRPDCPADLAGTIESLLRKDPAARPQGAREVVDALQSHRSAESPESQPAQGHLVHLEPGNHRLIVVEKDEDRSRRRQLRVEHRTERRTLESEVSRRARELMSGVLTYVGLDTRDGPTPEASLVTAVAEQAQVPPSDLALPPAVYQKRFVLADGISEAAANHIANNARTVGFDATVVEKTALTGEMRGRLLTVLLVCGWVGIAAIPEISMTLFFPYLLMMIAFSIVFPALNRGRNSRHARNHQSLPVAFGPDLSRWLSTPSAGRYAAESTTPSSVAVPTARPPTRTRGEALLERAATQLDALGRTIQELDLNAIAASDMGDTARDLRERATELADEIDRLDKEIDAESEDAGWIEPRLARLETKKRAGEPVDPAEIDKLQRALSAHREAEALTALLESQLTAATAGILEIASTASRVRRELLSQPDPSTSTSGALEKLKREATAADRTRREMARRAHKA